MFPNEHNVYLHDTPSKELFARDERAFSSGCIRVERPFELAELLLDGPRGLEPGEDQGGGGIGRDAHGEARTPGAGSDLLLDRPGDGPTAASSS